MHPALQIAQLLRELKIISGRKKLQKLVHILQELGYPFSEQFEYSHYGMYSRQLSSEIASLVKDNLIEEKEGTTQFGNPSFTLEILPQLSTSFDEIGVEKEPSWNAAANMLASYNAQTLEGISTILFLARCGFQGSQLKERLVSLKPHLADQYDHCERETDRLVQEFGVRPAAVAS